ncbi:MAG: hypothetical protein K0B10_05490 [Vicingaceae bacterium]|nr:hypothetical protein [Vicingaceae bacterium]
MKENNFTELQHAVLKQLISIIEVQHDAEKVIKAQKYEAAAEFRDKIRLLHNQLNESVKDWKNNVNALEISAENIDFIKQSKQFLSQFEDNTLAINQLILAEIEKLSEVRQTALTNKDFKLAGELLDKSVALKQKLE